MSEHFKTKPRVSWRDEIDFAVSEGLEGMKVAQRRKSLCEIAESVIRRLQNTSSWTGSEAECRDAVCLACSQRRCGGSPRSKLQRVSTEDQRTQVLGQAVNQSAEMRSAFEFFATAHSFPERTLESVN